ncbi:MAG: hypothetical protein RR406_04795 [Bacilli bacterium]
MKKLNCKKMFGENAFCLANRVIVNSLEDGSKKYGGATKINDVIFSNCNETSEFNIQDNNELGIIIPSTMDVNSSIDNSQYIEKVVDILKDFGKSYDNVNTVGGWISDTDGLVIEKGNLISFISNCNPFDIKLVVYIADMIKKEMKQEAVSIVVNESLAII